MIESPFKQNVYNLHNAYLDTECEYCNDDFEEESEWELPESRSHTVTYWCAAHTSVCRLSCTIHIVTDIICSLVSTGSDELSYQLTRVLPVIFMTRKIGQVNNSHTMEFPEILSQKFVSLNKYALKFENKTLCDTLKVYINTLYIQMKQLE